jgi:hypothetical protein
LKDCVIIAEGYFDLLTLHQYGLKHSVATLGTALTTQHIRTLKRYTRNLITLLMLTLQGSSQPAFPPSLFGGGGFRENGPSSEGRGPG